MTKTGSICFAATLEPVKTGEKPAIEKIELNDDNGLLTVRVFKAGGANVFKYDKKS